jgi:hypothetical protein
MRQQAVETEQYQGLTIKLYQDEQPESPREWDNLGTMVCFHRRYELGDKHGLSIEEAMLVEVADNNISLPLYLYDHSGLRMKVGSFQGLLSQGHAEFDSGKVGFIYVTAEDALKEYKAKRMTKALRAKVERVLEQEVDTYDQYLSGDVYGYVIEDTGGDHIDSCWGFYGGKYALEEARNAAKHYAEKVGAGC